MASAGAWLTTTAAPQTVWAIWSDMATWAQWNPDVLSAGLDGPLAVGATGTLVTKQARHKITIVALVPGRSFALEARPMPGMALRFTCEIEPQGAGSRFGQSVAVGGIAGAVLGNPMAKQIAKTFPPILDALKTRAETGP
jgi:hypothetical protein